MSTIIGLTGGIGSGKTTIASYFKSFGIPVYIADDEAKKLYLNPNIITKIVDLFGDKTLTNNLIDRKKLAQIVFNNPAELQKLNHFIHPLVKENFEIWVKNHQDYPILIKESALLFETKNNKSCHFVITVTASEEEKIKRVIQRDNATREDVLLRMKNQLSDKEKIAKSDFVINNDTLQNAKLQVASIIKNIENLIKKQ